MDVEIYQMPFQNIWRKSIQCFSLLIYFISRSSVAVNRKGFNTGNELLINQWRAGEAVCLGVTPRTTLKNWSTKRPAPSSTVRKSHSCMLSPGAHHLCVIWEQEVATRIFRPRDIPSICHVWIRKLMLELSSRVSLCLLHPSLAKSMPQAPPLSLCY